ncbi:hypothetical protein N7448_010166 [Penicillium atrosanguineum]|uniref:Uncharacterized protein n=1 Tax=Penicillium atrosanguineum TaxID=1132637 RepID=A0A9W9PLE0_9EURO|nr:uncharacterized protein N7443_007388 [Penicillium atrosanguineum]KAJ5118459.1 hypothetical protein N7526_010096 [Penicillium atrosanguineum]KAJ5119497.1 hypothetical protein N7448_010166 [Penicillium atrosanguineum]KAJ5296495.1 hypothetical protein N7443_007388 [Penicillium atrosanguineum]KAJ5299262.1 hypothetical protein N7476_010819 [Penicillium atrosanguineum]
MSSLLLSWMLAPRASPEDQTLQRRAYDSSSSVAANSPNSGAGSWIIDPLPGLQRGGLIAVATLAIVSLVATFSLLSFFTYRFIFWKKYYKRYIGYNQYVVLMYNLALADFIQGLGFIVSLRWISQNSLHATDAGCFLQGIWLQIGDPMSGMFVLAIALHTFMHVSLGRQLSHKVFVSLVVGLWAFGVILVIIPIAIYGRYVWVPSVAWCWMSTQHPTLRLWTHYFWIFAAQFLNLVLYAIMFVQLRRKMSQSKILGASYTESLRRMNRVVSYMVLYPIVYIALTLPLSAGRMASVSGHGPSVAYFCVAGALMTLSGFCDVLQYTLTRKSIVLEAETRSKKRDDGYYDLSTGQKKSKNGNLYSSEEKGPVSTVCAAMPGTDSTDHIIPRDIEMSAQPAHVYQHTTITVTHEPAYEARL